jgi:hypothetical protein
VKDCPNYWDANASSDQLQKFDQVVEKLLDCDLHRSVRTKTQVMHDWVQAIEQAVCDECQPLSAAHGYHNKVIKLVSLLPCISLPSICCWKFLSSSLPIPPKVRDGPSIEHQKPHLYIRMPRIFFRGASSTDRPTSARHLRSDAKGAHGYESVRVPCADRGISHTHRTQDYSTGSMDVCSA